MAKLTEKELHTVDDETLMERLAEHRVASKALPLKSQRKAFRKEAMREEKELMRRGHSKESLKRMI